MTAARRPTPPLNGAHDVDSDYVTVKEAAEFLGVNGATIRRWIDAGRLKGYRLGPRMLRVKRADLDALLSPVESRNVKEHAKSERARLPVRESNARKTSQTRRK